MKEYLTIVNDDGTEMMVEEPQSDYGFTYADYLKWNFKERIELIQGRIFKMSPAPNTLHQIILGKLFVPLYQFLEKKSCQVFPAPFDVRLPSRNKKTDAEITTVVQPDICVVCDRQKIDERGCCGAPDLIIEILSPGNSKKEIRIKFELYQEAGVKEYWIINPVEENLIIYTLNSEGIFGGGKMYAGDDVVKSHAISGFQIEANEIFTR